jgi:hypothetical protein
VAQKQHKNFDEKPQQKEEMPVRHICICGKNYKIIYACIACDNEYN